MTQKESRRVVLALVAITTLLVINLVVWRFEVAATKQLRATENIRENWVSYRRLAADLEEQRDLLRRLAGSYFKYETDESLRHAVESSNPKNIFVVRESVNVYDYESVFLYSPDESQSLVIEITTIDNGIESNEAFEIPLGGKKLHQLSSGVTGRNTARVTLDGHDVFKKSWPGFVNYTSSGSDSQIPRGLVQSNTLYNYFDELGRQIESGRWAQLFQNRHRFKMDAQRNSVEISIFLRGSGDFYIPYPQYWGTHDRIESQWDSSTKRHRIVTEM